MKKTLLDVINIFKFEGKIMVRSISDDFDPDIPDYLVGYAFSARSVQAMEHCVFENQNAHIADVSGGIYLISLDGDIYSLSAEVIKYNYDSALDMLIVWI